MSAKINNQEIKRLFDSKNLAYLATLMDDGSPQVTPIWVDIEGNVILVNTAEGRVKQKNVSRDPRVAISTVDNANPYEMVTVRGKVVEQTRRGADEHINKMAKKYLGMDKYPFKMPGEQRILLKIQPDKVFHQKPH
ncbi:MAG TPA: PPOX class F420-dependent oxidoreductase [Nitrososphaera sp.]|jgi:PPOX class probable F420-dependent enzyme|nr:PPOX class F420-dependent oxidoreductase [Nitrososphaera sp.]